MRADAPRAEAGPPSEWVRGIFGNSIALVDWLEPSDSLTVVHDVTVRRLLPFPARALHDPWLVPFLLATIRSSRDHRRLPRPLVSRGCGGHAVWLRGSFEADPGMRKARCSPLALVRGQSDTCAMRKRACRHPAHTELGTGSCRDMATLMMDAARLVWPRVSRAAISTAPHRWPAMPRPAWTEVYLPTLGWRGFDPTLGDISAPHRHRGGSHPRGVMPVSGASQAGADCRTPGVCEN